MDLYEILEVCEAYKDLGWSVAQQLHDMGSGDNNENAVDIIERKFLPLLPDDAADELRASIERERREAALANA